MRIALDAMGSNRAPEVEIEGGLSALRELDADFTLVLVGDRTAIEAELGTYDDVPHDRIEIVHAAERIEMGEAPAQAIRRKANSSIVLGLRLHQSREADAFISAGSTGAVMAGSLVILRTLPGVDRPPVGAIFPTAIGHTLMLDAGANVNTRPVHLHQFAHLGTVYARDLMGCDSPRVGLLNIGEEPGKGDDLTVEAHRLLAQDPDLNFVGNIEGRDIVSGTCDVLVCDGFVGNVVLKFYESVAGFMIDLVKGAVSGSDSSLDLSTVARRMDWTEYGGAPLLGVDGVSIICHGGSPARAIRNAIRVATQAVDHRMLDHMKRRFANLSTA